MTYIYVASSWRNLHYPLVISMLRGAGASRGADEPHYGVHDFRDPAGYFTWDEIDPDWTSWDPATFREKIHHPAADVGWNRDKGGLDKATACLLVGPCGRSAHLELGYAVGRGLPSAIYLPEPQEPELMYRFAGDILTTAYEVVDWAMGLFDVAAIAASTQIAAAYADEQGLRPCHVCKPLGELVADEADLTPEDVTA